MSDDVRQDAAQVLRTHSYRILHEEPRSFVTLFGCWGCDWQGDSSSIPDHQAQALADAGLLPTEVEWGVKYPRRDNDLHRGPWSKEEAESWIQEGIDDGVLPGAFILVSRRTTPWKDAP